jgi:catechol 2,3-dioxygenase-like lactoylglutathione lyase family enzyme
MKLNYVIKYVADMNEAVAFYRDTLGLELRFQSPGGPSLRPAKRHSRCTGLLTNIPPDHHRSVFEWTTSTPSTTAIRASSLRLRRLKHSVTASRALRTATELSAGVSGK